MGNRDAASRRPGLASWRATLLAFLERIQREDLLLLLAEALRVGLGREADRPRERVRLGRVFVRRQDPVRFVVVGDGAVVRGLAVVALVEPGAELRSVRVVAVKLWRVAE